MKKITPLAIGKMMYWAVNIVILCWYFKHLHQPLLFSRGMIFFAVIWVLISLVYGISLGRYLFSKGEKGTCM